MLNPLYRLLKVLKRSTGLRNTVTLRDPEDPSQIYRASYPLTALDDPSLGMPADIEAAIREDLREIFPTVAERPFCKSRICLYVVLLRPYSLPKTQITDGLEQTTTGDFLICPHPQFNNPHLATGGSGHAWKVLPLLGVFVVESITATLQHDLWTAQKGTTEMASHRFMTQGDIREIRTLESGYPFRECHLTLIRCQHDIKSRPVIVNLTYNYLQLHYILRIST